MELKRGLHVKLDPEAFFNPDKTGKRLKDLGKNYPLILFNREYEVVSNSRLDSRIVDLKLVRPTKEEPPFAMAVYVHWCIPWETLTLKDYLDD